MIVKEGSITIKMKITKNNLTTSSLKNQDLKNSQTIIMLSLLEAIKDG